MALLEPHNLPFLIAYGLLVLTLIGQLLGLSETLEGVSDFDAGDGLAVGGFGEGLASLLFTLSLLGVIEHLFLSLPFRDGMLWGWALPQSKLANGKLAKAKINVSHGRDITNVNMDAKGTPHGF